MTLAPNARPLTARLERSLDQGWMVSRVAPGSVRNPDTLPRDPTAWHPAEVPGTVGRALAKEDPTTLDQFDYWYTTHFDAPLGASKRALLVFDGLATLASVWLNGQEILTSENMFQPESVDVTSLLRPTDNALHLSFRALLPVLRARQPRGRFPTRLVSEKNLRFARTTLLGYQPGFCDHTRFVGPYRPVRLVLERGFSVERADVHARLDQTRGVLDVALALTDLGSVGETTAVLDLGRGRARAKLTASRGEGAAIALRGRVELEGIEPWWPHTHGEPVLHPVSVELSHGGEAHTIDLGSVGFRRIERRSQDDFALSVNGVPIFCRGAVWTPLDSDSLRSDPEAYRLALEEARDGGMNMLRISGTMVYEDDAFYATADALGILVWQDFMFARMDYPSDPAFLSRVQREAETQLARLHGHPCLAVLCGNSEVAQQAAMLGLPPEAAHNPIFDTLLPALAAERAPGIPYVSSSPSGGVMPFHTRQGPTHYFGVGAYLRPLDDARLARVRFASECLAFSNVPDESTLAAWLSTTQAPVHHEHYKAGVPRDAGAGWDFADVTDHYLESLFQVDARRLRYADHDRYLMLCRATTAEMMARVQGLWRARESTCHGALVWLLRDVRDGAGWGVIDARGAPKSCYFALKRAWAPVALWIVDDGLDGLTLHAANDGPAPLDARLEVELYREDGGLIEKRERPVCLGPRGVEAFGVEAVLGRFVDASYAYRFGPPGHSLVVARLSTNESARPIAQAFHLPLGLTSEARSDVNLEATVNRVEGHEEIYDVTLSSARFAQFVVIHAPSFHASDNHFHLAPRIPWTVRLRPSPGARPSGLRGKVRASNTSQTVILRVEPAAATRDQGERR